MLHGFDWCLSVIRKLNLLNSLITGKTSYLNNASLWIRLASSDARFIYNKISLSYVCFKSGSHLLSHTVSSIVSSAVWVLTIVFWMCTGVSPKRIATRIVFTSWIHWKLLRNFCCIQGYWYNCYQVSLITQHNNTYFFLFLRKEVIQPHLPIRLPCYDFTPVINSGGDALGGNTRTHPEHDG